MSDEIVWEDPPETPQGRSGARKEFVEALRARPGQWARYPREFGNTHVSSSAASALKATFGVEAVSRGTKVYARWPEGKEDAS